MKTLGIRLVPVLLAAVALLLTGCPHNEYIVQLKPAGDGMERTLVFYGADGTNATGAPDYHSIGAAEMAAITACYPTGTLTHEGSRYSAHATFTNQLPADVGGAGAYTRFTTSLGEAGFYAERFRGTNDLAGLIERKLKAADQMADLMLGWSRAELGQEPGYPQLRQYLDGEFRRDLKNAAAYIWAGQLAGRYQTNAPEEFIVRFSQYLWERGYFQPKEVPALLVGWNSNDKQAWQQTWLNRIQRRVAGKMGVPANHPVPAALGFLTNNDAIEASFDRYAAGTELYRAKLKQWNASVKTDVNARRPEPSDILQDIVFSVIADPFGQDDHLTVQLSLPARPLHTNGRWDEAAKQVLWETDIEGRTNAAHVPISCYASWVRVDEDYQTRHLGQAALAGDALAQYCVWRNGLDAPQGAEWDGFVEGLRPGPELLTKLDAFRFSGESSLTATNSPGRLSDYPREQLRTALSSANMSGADVPPAIPTAPLKPNP